MEQPGGQLHLSGNLALLAEPKIFTSWLRPLFRKDWIVYSKPPFGGPEYVLHYLGRYTHRVGISNHRLVSFEDGQVTFRWRDSAHNNEQELMALSLDEFLRQASCCILLGAIVEQVSGKDYNAYFDEHIFKPAEMISTSPAASSPGLTAVPYSGATATGLKPLPQYVGTLAGGGYSTVDDFLAFARAIQTRRLLDAKHTELLTVGKIDTGNGFYSLGLSVRSRNGEPCYGHGGSAPGVSGDLTIYPRSGYITAVLCNRSYPLAHNASDYIGFRLPV